MFNLFTPNAFEVAPATQAINDILFPVVLFGMIFMFLCAIFLDNPLPSVVSDEENIIVQDADSLAEAIETSSSLVKAEDYLERQPASTVAVIKHSQPQPVKVDLFDVDQECQKLRAFGARSLKAYCKEHKLSGYSTAANAGVEALAKFMLARQVKACDVQDFRSKFVA
ncbi:hypothetical protein NIES4071_103420 (plasmid) [Calothrix sp. NIES-4071]|nr:hypothetical protein NIES4071_103420 [Calothrix sp. NIES-4071]BAZ64329.1 hypothetical protein NIES4105_100620 [Calothrix sp. NIES-4105]